MNKHIRAVAFITFYLLFWNTPVLIFAQNELSKAQLNNFGFFIENKGQWDKQVRFLARLNDMNVWITEKGVVYDFYRIENNSALQEDPFARDRFKMPDTNIFIYGHVIKMFFPEHNDNMQFSGSGKLKTYYNYFLGKDPEKWTSFVSLYKEVSVNGIYPGIAARFYIESGRFRYDLIVQPGADITGFRLKFEGQNGLNVNEKGELVLKTSIGDMLNSNLFAYQELNKKNQPVTCKFVKDGQELIGFELGKYDHNLQLIIDPLVYSTYLGGNKSDQLNTIVVDKYRNAYVAGQSNSSNYPTTSGAYKTVLGLHQNGIITKLDPGSYPDFSTFIGDSTLIVDIALDTNDNVFVTGWTTSHSYPTTPGAFQVINKSPGAGGAEGFVTKMNSTGSALIFSTFLGGSDHDFPSRIKVDKQENAYITGATNSNDFPLSNGALQIIKSGLSDCFITKLARNGKSIIYSTFFGGKSVDVANDIAIDSIGDAYIVGRTQSSDLYTTTGSFQPDSIVTSVMGFLTKLNRFGTNLIYSTFLAGEGGSGLSNNITGVDIDTSGCAYVTGFTISDSFPVTTGSFRTSIPSSGKTHAFITKFDKQAATLVYSTYFGGNNNDYAYNINVDPLGNAFIGGTTTSTNLPFTPDAVQQLNMGNTDLFVAMLNPSGSALFYSTYFGGTNDDILYKIFYDGVNNVYLTGQAVSDNFPVTSGAYQQTKGSPCAMLCYGDGFVTRINLDPPTILTNPIPGFPTCAGTYISVPYSVRSLFDTGNKFLVQLSDTAGSFTKPLQIGSLSGRGSGTITAQLPVNLKYSTKYRVRVVATNPASTGTDNGTDLTIDSATIRNFAISDTIGCLNNNSFLFSFDTNYLSQIMHYHWNFGDGDTSNLLNPQHTYKTADTFTVSLELTNALNCIDTLTQRVFVFKEPKAKFAIVDSSQCFLGNKFEFINNSTINSGTFKQTWYFGDGDSSLSFDTTHTYAIADTFKVKLLVISDWGCLDSATKSVYLSPSPIAGFTTIDTAQCLNGNNFPFINVTKNPRGNIITYHWKFGDGTTDTATNPTHAYLTDSLYTVQLSAISDIGCSDSVEKNIIVSPHPKAAFSVNDSNQCLSGNSFVFTNLTKYKKPGTGTYLWKFGDGNTDTTTNPAHSYGIDDTFTVQLNAISDMGCNDSVSANMIVRPKPIAGFSINDTDQCLSGNSFVFTNLTLNMGTGAKSYLWKFGDGNSDTATNPIYSYTTADTFMVELTAVSDIGCSDTIIKSVIIRPKPQADFSANDTDQCLTGNRFVFTNLTTNLGTGSPGYLWKFGDGNSDTATNPIHSYSSADTFMIELTAVSAIGCRDSVIKNVIVFPMPVAGFSINSNPQYLPGNNFIFTNLSNTFNQGKDSWLWNYGDGDTSTQTDGTHSYKTVDTFDVTLYVVTGKGCRDSITKKVWLTNLLPQFRVDFMVGSVCAGEYALFSNTSTIKNDSFLNFMWDFGDSSGTIVRHNPYHMYTDTGTYMVKLVGLTALGLKDSVTYPIQVMQKPDLTINYSPDTILVKGTVAILTATGTFNSIFWSTGAQTASINVDSSGLYSVRVVALNGCEATDSINVLFYESQPFNAMTVITPNGDGINDLWKIFGIEQYQPCKLVIYNRWGDELYSSSDYRNTWDGRYNGKYLPSGTYYYVLEARDGKVYKGAVNVIN